MERKSKLFVLLADVAYSRKIENRDDFQENLLKVCQEINEEYDKDIYADFKILKGLDEIGAVLISIRHVYEIIDRILVSISPNCMRFALAYDYIDTALKSRDITRMDGPAFHKASEMILTLKESEYYFDMSLKDDLGLSINTMINLILLYKGGWTQKQRQIIDEYEREQDQSKVAEKYNLTQQGVSKILKRTNWKEINKLENQLNKIIYNYSQQAGSMDEK